MEFWVSTRFLSVRQTSQSFSADRSHFIGFTVQAFSLLLLQYTQPILARVGVLKCTACGGLDDR